MIKRGNIQSEYQGKLLLATPKMADFRFERSVILICSHSSNGAMGIIVNKPTLDWKFEDILKQLKINTKLSRPSQDVFFGGPVEYGRGFIVHSDDYEVPEVTVHIKENYRLTANADILCDMANGKGPKSSLLALGYAGWAPGQLEDELLSDSWLMCDPDSNLIFSENSENKWSAALSKMGVSPSHLATFSGQA
jgi:putative transcriptional regulator